VAGWHQPFVDPWVALTAAAMTTEHIRLGTTVTPLPRRRPAKLARETASVDVLSGGRLLLGVGIGGGGAEWEGLGEETDLRKRGAMLDEGLDVVTGLWGGGPFSYAGSHYTVRGADFLPRPVQSPRIPIWVGGIWPAKPPFRRMARWDGMFPLIPQADDLDDKLARFREAVSYVLLRRESEDPFDVVAVGETSEDDPGQGQELAAKYASAGATWWLEGIASYRFEIGLDEPVSPELLRARVLAGPPCSPLR